MNLFLITDSKEADVLTAELAEAIPAIRVTAFADARDAIPQLVPPGACDTVVLDESVPVPDTLDLVYAIRNERRPIGIIVLTQAAGKELPPDLLKSGVDRFLPKGEGYVAVLAETLPQVKNRYRKDNAPQRRQVHLLYAGNFEAAQQQLAAVPQIKLTQVLIAPDGLPETLAGPASADAVVIESAATGDNTQRVIKEFRQKLPDVPVVILSEPGDEETAIHSMRSGAADCIAKTGSHLPRLLFVLQREIARRELIRERAALQSREERLRHIVEGMPAGVTVIAQDGTFLAINDAGLKLLGASRLDQMVGKNVADFIPAEKDRILGFLSTVCGGADASIRIDWHRQDGTSIAAEFQAAPMRRDAAGAIAALVVLSDASHEQVSEAEKKKLEQALDEHAARLRELRDQQIQQESRLESALRQSESRRIAAEEEISALKASIEAAANRHRLLLDEQRVERESWEQARQDFQEQCLKTEGSAESLRSAQTTLLDNHRTEKERWEQQRRELEQKQQLAEERLAHLSESLEQERSNWNARRQELGQKQRGAEELCEKLEASLVQKSEESATLLSQHNLAKAELEQKLQSVEQQRISQETALNEAESKIAQITGIHREELLQRDLACRELEQKLQAVETQNLNLHTALQNDQLSLVQTAEKHVTELSQRDAAHRELQEKLQSAENEKTTLEAALRESESRVAGLLEKHGTASQQRDSARREMEQKCESAEAHALALQLALREAESRLQNIDGVYKGEISRRDIACRELEQKLRAVEAQMLGIQNAAQNTESSLSRATEQYTSELSRRDQAFQELEQRYKSLDEQNISLQSAFRNAESSLVEMSETHIAELRRRDLAYQGLEQKCKSLEAQVIAKQNELSEARSDLAQLAETHAAELLVYRTSYQELEEKVLQIRQERQSTLAEMREEHGAELFRRDAALKELEQNHQESEKQKAALQISIRNLEASLAQLSEKHSIELSQRDFAQKKSEQKYLASEKERMVQEDALRDAKSNLARFSDTYDNERAQWNLVRQELEQKGLEAEKLHAAAMQNLIRETESRLAWISEQNQAKAMQIEKMQEEICRLKAECDRLTEASSTFHLRNQRLSQFTSVGVVLARLDGQVLECNDSAARMFGYEGAQQALSRSGPDPFRIYPFEGALAARLRQEGKLENIEWSSLGRDGRLVRVQENATLIQNPAGDGPLVERVLTDISKIHILSEEVRRARRLQSTGDLAAAAVKSLKELCASLAHSGELLVKSPNDSSSVQRIAEALLTDANRGVRHARQFLSVSMKADRVPSLLNLNEIVVNNDSLLHSLIGEDIDLQTTLAPRIGLVSADPNELVQLIGNLLSNSREALPLGGIVTIETCNIEVDSADSGYPGELKPGIYVRIVFSADGCAIQPGRRMGPIRTLVERMGGHLESINDPKVGNIHRVYLPRVEASASQSAVLSGAVTA